MAIVAGSVTLAGATIAIQRDSTISDADAQQAILDNRDHSHSASYEVTQSAGVFTVTVV